MKERMNKLSTTYPALSVLFILLSFASSVHPQSFCNGTMEFIFKPQDNVTQFTIWVEEENGDYVQTIYVTNFIGRRGGANRTGDTNIDSNTGNRLSALPVWAYKRDVIDTTFGIENYYPPAETKASYPEDMDAVSGATPNSSIQTKTWPLSDLPSGIYTCWIEANKSFDFNPYHNYSFYRGQPSVVWKAMIGVSDSADTGMSLDYFGYGSPDGSDGEINPPDSTITTAVDLLGDLGGYRFKVVYTPDPAGVENTGHTSGSVGSFYLNQNYPNPFNSSTGIGYFLPKACHVRFMIYDIRGQTVAVLADGEQTAGYKRVFWNGRNVYGEEVVSGIYLCKIQAGEFTVTKTMVFMK